MPSGCRAEFRSNGHTALWGWDEHSRSQIQDKDITENMLTPVGIRKRPGEHAAHTKQEPGEWKPQNRSAQLVLWLMLASMDGAFKISMAIHERQ